MPNNCITYQKSGYFTPLLIDYLDESLSLQKLYNRFPKIENFKAQIKEKAENFPVEHRNILAEELENQYQNFEISGQSLHNIQLLKKENTFTITTGHQLNLFTGPVYFLYKIVSVINLCKELKTAYPENNFVPIFWLASEDHDFEEINHFYYNNTKIAFQKEARGAVGKISTHGLLAVFEEFSSKIGISENAEYLKDLFKKAYLEHHNFADATRFLANEIFKNEGLVIVDGNSKELKKLFKNSIKKELTQQITYKKVTETIANFKYSVQVNPREVNLFYLEENLRERIVFDGKKFSVLNTNLSFTENEILQLVEHYPEKFSPNVLMRPMYQETVLPNLCYIGGGAEVAYWLQLKSTFVAFDIVFPMVLLRNSVVISSKKQVEKMQKLSLSWEDLFKKHEHLIVDKTKEFSQFKIDFTPQKQYLQKQFEELLAIASQTDKSFIKAVKAQEKKQTNGLEHLEKRLLKAEKRNHNDKLQRITALQEELFPNQILQERKINFSEFYINHGDTFLTSLLDTLKPLEQNFSIITL